MVVRVERISQRILDGTTDEVVSGRITGKILSIKVYAEATFEIKAITENCPVPEYILGTAIATVSMSAGNNILYPKAIGSLNSDGTDLGAANQTNAYQEMEISAPIKFEVSSGTTAKKWSVEIIYEG